MIMGLYFKIRGVLSLQLWFLSKCFSLSPFSEWNLGCPFSPKSPGALYSKSFFLSLAVPCAWGIDLWNIKYILVSPILPKHISYFAIIFMLFSLAGLF